MTRTRVPEIQGRPLITRGSAEMCGYEKTGRVAMAVPSVAPGPAALPRLALAQTPLGLGQGGADGVAFVFGEVAARARAAPAARRHGVRPAPARPRSAWRLRDRPRPPS